MKHKIIEGIRHRSSTPPPLLLPNLPPAAPADADESPASEDGRPPAEQGGQRGAVVEKLLDGEDTPFPSEANGRQAESDDDGDESDKDEGVEEEYEEEEEGEPAPEEQIVGANASGEDRPKLAEGFFEVEAIRRKRIFKGEPQYLIKWRGWPESSNTWEPLEHLQLCPDIVEAFEQSLNSGKKTRKRKRKYTHSKKKMQYSGSKEHNRGAKRTRVGRKAYEKRPSYDPSYTGGSKETKGDENSNDKDNVPENITIQLEEGAKGDGSPVNSSSKIDSSSAEPNQGDRRTGAKRRKSGTVQRFKPNSSSSDPSHAGSSVLVNGIYDSAQQLMVGNTDPYSNIKFDFSRDSASITRILKPIGYSMVKANEVKDVLVTFVAMRSDGKEVMVDNKYLKANYPHVLIDFYEQHLRYSPAG